jgi:signal transduction histidine kinase
MESDIPLPNPMAVPKATDWLRRLLYERTLLVLIIMFCIGVVIILWHVYRLQSNLIESVTLNNASLYAQALEEFRTLYTSEVAVRVRAKGVEVTHDYDVKEGAIPLPATLSLLLGNHIAAKGTGGQPRLYSDYPFPWRQDGGPQDDFERQALQYLRQHPDQAFTRLEPFKGHLSLRYAKADRMRESCVSCHNMHPDSPRTTWQEGDVRGVLEVILPLDAAVAQTHANLRGTFYLVMTMTVFGVLGLMVVIGAVRRSTMEAQRLAEEAARAHELTQLKSEFVTLVAHELRSPLTSITGYVELLLERPGGTSAEGQREFLGIVKRNADRLLQLIDDLLDIARIEAGKVELRRTRLDLAGLIQEVAKALRPQIEAKGQRLTLDLAEALPAVTGNADRVTQILTNLLSNAHKYTPPAGSITITARGEEGEEGRVRVNVQDTGVGLSSDDQAQLFTKFFRAQHRTTAGVGGTGLGLAITRALVELHGGEITVTSTLGQGTTFGFTLPATWQIGDYHHKDPTIL